MTQDSVLSVYVLAEVHPNTRIRDETDLQSKHIWSFTGIKKIESPSRRHIPLKRKKKHLDFVEQPFAQTWLEYLTLWVLVFNL